MHQAYDSTTYVPSLAEELYYDYQGNLVGHSSTPATVSTRRVAYPASVSNRKVGDFRSPSAYGGTYFHWTYGGERRRSWYLGTDWQTTQILTNGYGGSQPLPQLHGLSDKLVDRAVTKALLKLKNQQVNLAVAFAERSETAELVTSMIQRITRLHGAYKARRPLDWRTVKRLSGIPGRRGEAIPNSWLEFQYGIQPTMQDAYGAVSALKSKDLEDGSRYRYTVRGSSKVAYAGGFEFFNDGYPTIKYVKSDEVKQEAKVRLDYALENPLLHQLASLGILNPALVVWEKVPYSFVVDWFLPIGDYLSCMDAAAGFQFLNGTLTISNRRKGEASEYGQDNDFYKNVSSTMRWSWDLFQWSRSLYSSSPLPRVPRFKNPLSTGHLANALALLVSSFRR